MIITGRLANLCKAPWAISHTPTWYQAVHGCTVDYLLMSKSVVSYKNVDTIQLLSFVLSQKLVMSWNLQKLLVLFLCIEDAVNETRGPNQRTEILCTRMSSKSGSFETREGGTHGRLQTIFIKHLRHMTWNSKNWHAGNINKPTPLNLFVNEYLVGHKMSKLL